MPQYTLADFARLIDHTNLKAYASAEDIIQLCNEAKEYHFKMVAVNQVQSKLCAEQLAGTDIDVGAAISFPLGQTTVESKEFDTKNAIENGATEIDYVINITELKNKNYAYLEDEMTRIVAICHAHQIPCKVIFENCYLTKDEIKQMAEIALKVKPDFIKTATGFGTGGATVEDVKLMKSVVGDSVKVKAAGGIRNSDTFLAMIQAGADRIGTSSGIAIMNALKQRMDVDHVDSITIDRPYAKVKQ
ncbi:deoxyribose-phosphate aldolase (phosphodeoxyriboaldolase) (deoxyriboaldolase) (dera) [Lactobacillus selangorensis]|uniref:Deoxyribose-phosphate aldolase n=1 Tax=Lactobacillus selangorensis TaxID=81857 RepID=A0A0R2FWQ6_9LACO|nr:deoxyribose-phosphate aldolase [Lactobacillus selangorensis]KRN28797.1 deoxyribose-phosphate aldolase (phosphodeoxyriboaldolase) (deoxyriboaldolase) (dera) [Lactobacillus selangorensis]KRN32793.1 deoxyribose-phosphate aldolase (phosphodeoxyriboaldolase) (deoxyriboaldolase) (dera) [Lactobacillus selangorensis]